MSIRLIAGDCRDVLLTLAAESVQCVVCSPPYYGLRDYGTALWDGGDVGCDHARQRGMGATTLRLDGREHLGVYDGEKATQIGTPFRDVCGRCGAVRVDRQIGLEATLEAYLAVMVGVFREVKRVLRSDGCAFVNLGDSYCSATQCVRYELREDLSLSELQNVALAVFGVRITGDEASGAGIVPEVLPVGIQGRAVCERPDVASQRVEEGVSSASVGCHSENVGTKPSDQARRDSGAGRQMRLLRGDDPAIPDVGSHQWGWSGAQEASDREQPGVVTDGLSRGEATGLSKGPVSHPVLQLQLRDRIMGLLSARQFAEHEVPAAVRACFKASATLKPKDLLLMPARLALALQADGWWVRSAITWCKPSPMPESCTDRPTSATEMVYLLTKSAHYFYDSIAIREDAVSDHPSGNGYKRDPRLSYGGRGNDEQWNGIGGTRNARNWWVINSKPFPQAHFATFPPELAERCIKAGTSERGCCAACGKPWVRQVSKSGGTIGTGWTDHTMDGIAGMSKAIDVRAASAGYTVATTGWSPGCQCNADTVPCTVLDPFAGAGTTLLVADRLQRDAVGIELNAQYTEMAMERCRADAPLFTSFPPAEPPEDERMGDLFTGMAAD